VPARIQFAAITVYALQILLNRTHDNLSEATLNQKLIYSMAIAAMVAAPWLSRAHAGLGGGEVPQLLQNATAGDLGLDGVYEVTHAKPVHVKSYVIDGKSHGTDGDLLTYNLEAGSVIGVEHLSNAEVRISFGQIDGDDDTLPSSITVSSDQIKAFDISYRSNGGLEEVQTAYEDLNAADDEVASRKKHVAVRSHHRGRGGWGDGGCVTYIKKVTGCYGHLGNGNRAAYGLERNCGYHSIPCSSMTRGMIVQWGGRLGHVAQWDGSCYETDVRRACSINHGDPGMGRPTLCVIR
jgi:hypothetical protein